MQMDGRLSPLRQILLAAVLLLASGCSLLSLQETPAPTPAAAVTETKTPAEITQEPPAPAATATPASPTLDTSQITLRVWVPPQFDPYNGTPAGELMRLRLADFAVLYPGMRIEVRVKALDGPGGLLDSLASASAAAPAAAPDLIALSRMMMESAALKGLLHPYDGLSLSLEGDGWFDYSRQLAGIQGSTFGIPFAGDSLVLIYDPATPAPSQLETLLNSPTMIAFPTTDPQALLTLALYMAAGGTIQDEQGRPHLDAAILEQVLSFYSRAAQINLLLPQVNSPADALTSFIEGRVDFAAVWASDAFPAASELGDAAAIAPLPTLAGNPFSLANGWVWALSSSQPERQGYAVELAEFITDPEFLTQWTRAARGLPVQDASLAAWDGSPQLPVVEQVARNSVLIPSVDVLLTLGPVLHQAALDVMSQQMDPKAAAEKAAAAVK